MDLLYNISMDGKAYQHKYYLKNKERILARQSAFNKAHPDRANAWHRAHSEEMKEYRKKYCLENKEKIKYLNKEWRRLHPEYGRERCKKITEERKQDIKFNIKMWARDTLYHHKYRGIKGTLTTAQLIELAGKTDHCFYCGDGLHWEYKGKGTYNNTPSLDRIHNGKTIDIENIRIICHSCNWTKGSRTDQEFIIYCKKIAKIHGNSI
jgi:hypothetical protein